MTDLTVTVGGLPGTGTSTLCRLLEIEFRLPHIYAGQIFREEAVHRGLTLAQFNELSQHDPAIDEALDERQLDYLRQGGLVLEGRLSGWLAHRYGIRAFKIWLVCSIDERVRRLVERDGGDSDTQRRMMEDRESRERDRYRRYYGVDLDDTSVYDLVVDSTSKAPEGLLEEVRSGLEAWDPD